MSQKSRILRHLKNGHSLSQLGALHLFGCLRLSERIREIQREGHPIRKHWSHTKAGKRVLIYSMGQPI